MQAFTPRLIHKSPLRNQEENKNGRGESDSRPRVGHARFETCDSLGKVIDQKLIYNRKPTHKQSNSIEAGVNFQKSATLQLQMQHRCGQPPNRKIPQQKQSPSNENTTPQPQLQQLVTEEPVTAQSTVPSSKAGERAPHNPSSGKPPIALKPGHDRSQQMSRALRVKEENKQVSLALKKATAEAALNTNYSSQRMAEFALQHRCSNSSNRSQVLSSFTVDGGVSTGTNTTETSNDQQRMQTANGVAASQVDLQRKPQGMQAIPINGMNISQAVKSPRPPAQINNLYSHSHREINNTSGTQDGKLRNNQDAEDSVLQGTAEKSESAEKNNAPDSKIGRRVGSLFMNNNILQSNQTPEKVPERRHLNYPVNQSKMGSNISAVSSVPTTAKDRNSTTEKSMLGSAPLSASNEKASATAESPTKSSSQRFGSGRKHVTDDFFLHQSKNAIQLRRVIDYEMKRKVQANPRLIYQATPKISAHYWAIFDGHKQSFIHGKREYMKREVASLTKIMTVYTVLDLARQYKIKLNQTKITVCGVGSNIRGTTAKLKKGDILTAEELLFGTMLPSGNDAAFVLAKYFGRLLFEKKGYDEKDIQRIRSYQFNYHPYYVKYFLKQMNDNAVSLKLMNSFFDSPHGLMNPQNVSTAYDMARLSAICMQIPIFRRIASTKTYECRAVRAIQRPIPQPTRPPRRALPAANNLTAAGVSASPASSSCEESSQSSSAAEEKFETIYRENDTTYNWVNTNRLLGIDGFTGTKTGITEAAGACLASCFEKDGNFIVVVILQSKTMDARWEEAQLLIDWAVQRRQLMAPLPSSQQHYPNTQTAYLGLSRGLHSKQNN